MLWRIALEIVFLWVCYAAYMAVLVHKRGPIGGIFFYPQVMIDRVKALGLITEAEFRKRKRFACALLIAWMLVVPGIMILGINGASLQIKSQPLRAKNLRRQRSVRHENDKKTTQEGGQTEVAQPSRRVKDKRPSAVPTASLTRRAVYAHGQSRGWFPTPVNQG